MAIDPGTGDITSWEWHVRHGAGAYTPGPSTLVETQLTTPTAPHIITTPGATAGTKGIYLVAKGPGGDSKSALIEQAVTPGALDLLRAISGTSFALYAKKVARRRALAASADVAIETEYEHSSNGFLVKQGTLGSRPKLKTDTGAAGGLWYFESDTDRFFDIRNAADTTDVLGSNVFGAAQGCILIAMKVDSDGENAINCVPIGAQTAAPKLVGLGCEGNEVRVYAGHSSSYAVVGAEPRTVFKAYVVKWNTGTGELRGRPSDSAIWVAGTPHAADTTTALAAALKIFKGSGGTANKAKVSIFQTLNVCPSDADVDTATTGHMARLVAALAASTA